MNENEAKSQWQDRWRQLPAEERGGAQQVFAFVREYGQDLPTEWEGQQKEPWTTIHGWLKEADERDGIEWDSR